MPMATGTSNPREAGKEFHEKTGGGRWKPKEGKNRIFILPTWDEDLGRFYKMVFFHYFDGQSIICPRRTSDNHQSCAICAMGRDLKESESLADQEAAKKLMPTTRVFVNLLDWIKVEDTKKVEVRVGELPSSVFTKLYGWLEDDPKGKGDFTRLDGGYVMEFMAVGSGMLRKYDDYEYGRQVNLGNYLEKIEAQMVNLDQMVEEMTPSPDEVSAIVRGASPVDEGDFSSGGDFTETKASNSKPQEAPQDDFGMEDVSQVTEKAPPEETLFDTEADAVGETGDDNLFDTDGQSNPPDIDTGGVDDDSMSDLFGEKKESSSSGKAATPRSRGK